ncbi:zinc finger domain-containing protein [Niveispirillum sp. KHB5.9]|uniref:zinc finger domain-containing protein n=1 Tax=Niveispirillum sp. KHB5.9 TaxID=3400269 RepID=UPI003A86CB85
MSKADDLVYEYEAAIMVGMSPELLKWFTSYAPKQGDSRKLKLAHKSGYKRYYSKREILDFNNWLKAPWPSVGGARPPVPIGIRLEIQREAGYECAMCGKYSDACEAAHIDPVSKSKNNHPENLIWLCANHHTMYDKNIFSTKGVDVSFIKAHKLALIARNKWKWQDFGKLHDTLLSLLTRCDDLLSHFKSARSPEEVAVVKKLAVEATMDLYRTAKSDASPEVTAIRQQLLPQLGRASSGEPALEAHLMQARQIRKTYVAALGYVKCPLCHASGRYNGDDCPVCHGDREIDANFATQVDLTQFQTVPCPVCEGGGRLRGVDCPVCQGDRALERRYADRIDVHQFDDVECPLCAARGKNADCSVCHGEYRTERRYADLVDLKDFQNVDCPLCASRGKNADCPVCHGEYRIERQYADRVDLKDFQNIDCKLCEGSGRVNHEDCPACDGNGMMERHIYDGIDWRGWDIVDCPRCHGKGHVKHDDCRYCGGAGTMYRQQTEYLE